MDLLKSLEGGDPGTSTPLAEVLDALNFNEQGLIAAIAQEATTREVLMLAWMDRTAIERTLADGLVCYYSRSRRTYWRKGETSGHLQKLNSMAFDCDGDAVLLQVEQTGPACHTHRPSCFYLAVSGIDVTITSTPIDGGEREKGQAD